MDVKALVDGLLGSISSHLKQGDKV